MWEKIKNYIKNMITQLTGINTALPYKPMIGKHKAHVIDNRDPLRLGRVIAKLKNGMVTKWAKVGAGSISNFDVPPEGTGVWIEFEEFDPSKPIWTGCYYELDKFGTSNTPATSERQKITDSKHTQILQDDTAKAITILNKHSGAFMRMLKSGSFENQVTGDKLSGIDGKDQAAILGSWIRSVGNEAVLSVAKAFRQTITGETHVMNGDNVYLKQIIDVFNHYAGGANYTSGMKWELTATGFKLIMGVNIPPTLTEMDTIPAHTIELDLEYMLTGKGKVTLSLFDTNKIELTVDEIGKELTLKMFGMEFHIANVVSKLVEFDDKNGFKFSNRGADTEKVFSATIQDATLLIDKTNKVTEFDDNRGFKVKSEQDSEKCTFTIHGCECVYDKVNKILKIKEGQNNHEFLMDDSGVKVTDGKNSGNIMTMSSSGVVIDGTGGGKLELK